MILLCFIRVIYGIYGIRSGEKEFIGTGKKRGVFKGHLNTYKILAFGYQGPMADLLKKWKADFFIPSIHQQS